MRIRINGTQKHRKHVADRLVDCLNEVMQENFADVEAYSIEVAKDGARVVLTLIMDAPNEESLYAVTDRVVSDAIDKWNDTNQREADDLRLLGSGLVPA
ncbi:hypothetical protein [Demequina sp.]|uniref:hypothetical protein n=1 Tax=Demequina sp. TaxID=2050685 RepID=UPI003D0AE1BA